MTRCVDGVIKQDNVIPAKAGTQPLSSPTGEPSSDRKRHTRGPAPACAGGGTFFRRSDVSSPPQSARTRHASISEIFPSRARRTAAWVMGTMPSATAAWWMASAFAPGTMLVMDRGYENHAWWRQLSLQGVYFVTRLKDSTSYTILATREVPDDGIILRDEEIMLNSEKDHPEPMRLRRIEVWVEDKQCTLAFVTNHPRLAASTISAIYKDRWQIELFFKAIKQSLRIKTFIGTSENAVHIQIWTALIAMLLVRYLQMRSSWNWSLSNLFALLRQQLFVYRDMWAWLNEPLRPPVDIDSAQLSLVLT